MTRAGGTAVGLFVKSAKGAPMRATDRLDFLAGKGVVGDASAGERSTRQVLLVAEGAARRLALAPGALRENLCVAGLPVDGLASGTALRIGEAVVRITFPCDPCALLRRYAGIAPHRARGRRGMLAVVVADGTATTGDPVVDLGVAYEQLPDHWHDRLGWFLARLPAGAVMTYGDLTAAVGQVPSVARALPRLLAAPRYASLPTDRVVTCAGLKAAAGAQRWAYWEPLYALPN